MVESDTFTTVESICVMNGPKNTTAATLQTRGSSRSDVLSLATGPSAKVSCAGPSLLVIFHQAFDDPAGREQCFLFLFIELGNGLSQPHPFCIAGDLPHRSTFGGEFNIHLAPVGRVRLSP